MMRRILIVSILFLFSPSYLMAQEKNTSVDRYSNSKMHIEAIESGKSTTTELWLNYSHDDKLVIIEQAIGKLKKEKNVIVNKSPEFYVQEIDKLIKEWPRSLQLPLGILFKTVAIIEDDYDEGIDKKETAKNYLGNYYNLYQDVYSLKHKTEINDAKNKIEGQPIDIQPKQ